MQKQDTNQIFIKSFDFENEVLIFIMKLKTLGLDHNNIALLEYSVSENYLGTMKESKVSKFTEKVYKLKEKTIMI